MKIIMLIKAYNTKELSQKLRNMLFNFIAAIFQKIESNYVYILKVAPGLLKYRT